MGQIVGLRNLGNPRSLHDQLDAQAQVVAMPGYTLSPERVSRFNVPQSSRGAVL